MFDRFTNDARKTCSFARAEADRFHHDYIGPEHLLLGLIKETSGCAAEVFRQWKTDLEQMRRELEKLMKPGPDAVTMGQLPFTALAKKVLEYSIDEARAFGHNYVGTEHLLLGLLRADTSLAAQVLSARNLKIEDVRSRIREILGAVQQRPAAVIDPPLDPQYASGNRPRFANTASGMMFDRFTDRSRKIMSLARQASVKFNHDYIGTEHILLGLIIEGTGVAVNVLENLDVDGVKARSNVEARMKPGTPIDLSEKQLPFTPRAKKVLEFAIDEARALDHNYVGSEHLLLGLLRENEGLGAQALVSPNIRSNAEPLTLEVVREAVKEFLGE